MESFDPEKARRVWKRVQEGSSPPMQDWSCADVLSIKARTADMYERLSRYFRGRNSTVMQKFYRQERAHIAVFSELSRTHTGQAPALYTPLPRKEPADSLLQQCYGYKLQLMNLYAKYGNIPQYSGTFEKIISEEQAQCRFLLELMERRKNPYPRGRR